MFSIENTKKFIIAMKGPPFTRKTEFASLIAKSLKCPILSINDVLNSLDPDNNQTRPSSTCMSPNPQDVAFHILCDIARSHLLQGIFDNIVINSRLSSQSHLDKLINLAHSLLPGGARIVIVECKPKNTYSWRLKFQSYLEKNSWYAREWYKPKNWEDVEMSIKDDNDLRLDDDQVSKLVLDPFIDGPYFNPTIHMNLPEPPRFMEAVQYMMAREIGDGPNLVVYNKLYQSQYTQESNDGQPSKKQGLCRDGHCISNYSNEGLEHEARCMACERQVIGAAYTCKDCSLALHKECAESFDSQYKWGNLGERLACTLCKEDGKGFSIDCGSCLFETRLKCDMKPTVIRHKCEEHFLSTLASPVQGETYICAACGDHDFGVSDIYTCRICNVFYHYKCLTKVPSRLKHVHGGHHHHMFLMLSIDYEAEDYICDECLDYRDPQHWFYSCEECCYVTHLYCVLRYRRKDFLFDPTKKTPWKQEEHTIVFFKKGALSSELKCLLEKDWRRKNEDHP